MNDIIIVKDLTFKYDDKEIFNRLTFTIKEGKWVTLIGPNGSGKSTLVKLLTGLLKTYAYININNKILCRENAKEIRKNIGIVFENPDNQFVAETVMDDIAFSLENMQYSKKEIRSRIKEIGKELDIENIMEKEPHAINSGEKQIVALASALVIKPKILILDEALTMLDQNDKTKIINILTKLHKETKMTIINVTHDLEESVYGDEIIVLDDGKIVAKGNTKDVLNEEKLFVNLGLDLPFMAELSHKLKFYGLTDDIILDMNEMVDQLWK